MIQPHRHRRLEAIDELEVVERIYRIIQESELDCADWHPDSQKLLAFEIACEMHDIIETRILRMVN